jgi:hypothetical protein
MEPQPKPPMGPQGQGEPQEEGGGAKQVVTSINNNLLKLKELIGGVPSVSDEVKAELDALIQGYQGLIQKIAGGGQGQPGPGAAAPSEGPMPPRGGMGRASSMGGPGAKPAM